MVIFTLFDYSPERASKYLVENALKTTFGDGITLEYDDNHAPRLRGIDLNISISHSKDVFVFAVSHSAIGVDVEKVVPRDYTRIGEKMNFPVANTLEDFYRNWTAFEARYKANNNAIGCKYYDLNGDYILAVACDDLDVTFVTIEGEKIK